MPTTKKTEGDVNEFTERQTGKSENNYLYLL